jgi:hypothetical protein
MQEETDGTCGEGDSECASGEREDEAFGEELTNDAEARGSEGLADGEFAGADGGACEEEIRYVGTGNEQHESDDSHEDTEGL